MHKYAFSSAAFPTCPKAYLAQGYSLLDIPAVWMVLSSSA
jgi:hypothetical protein